MRRCVLPVQALLEGDEEWSQHDSARCIDTKGKGIRRSVPESFPYFHVEFGCTSCLPVQPVVAVSNLCGVFRAGLRFTVRLESECRAVVQSRAVQATAATRT